MRETNLGNHDALISKASIFQCKTDIVSGHQHPCKVKRFTSKFSEWTSGRKVRLYRCHALLMETFLLTELFLHDFSAIDDIVRNTRP